MTQKYLKNVGEETHSNQQESARDDSHQALNITRSRTHLSLGCQEG